MSSAVADPRIVSIASRDLRAEISELGAELVRLQDGDGRELLWNGDPAYWTGHAPLLFPIVGSVKGDVIRVHGKTYPLQRHGFARRSRFQCLASTASRCQWRLASSSETRAQYPFNFTLDVVYEIVGPRLEIVATATNTGSERMPVSFGFHPAFHWPLPYGRPREEHAIRFEMPEPLAVRRLENGLLAPHLFASPVHDHTLALADDLFRDDALIFDRLASRKVTYGAATGGAAMGPQLEVAFPDMPHLGIWSKPGAGFVCIEPWHGFASPTDFDDELRTKPGMAILPPGDAQAFEMKITLRR
ncbi:Galactose mutarotase [Enhydrobacter aerosaccus]|uniref:Galactose mutarotase n=1 Tax=Enhydrobacter aerosaccus TaxID=225324 RepID=A0A1T4TAX5_9HYPH|nr:aldose 1-epimerase family protein [Enhydrobacter aerosaccus]SKA37720.1 Galactose mutarotase [Enhydrobacter aerosaccus]